MKKNHRTETINSDGKTIGNFNFLFVLIHIFPVLLYEPTKPLKDRRARISPDLLCVNKGRITAYQ